MGRGKGVPGGRIDEGKDRSWMRWSRCKVCGRKICVNNNYLREIDPTRIKGVVVCPWCTEPAVELYLIVKGLADLYEGGHETPKRERLKLMRRAWDRVRG